MRFGTWNIRDLYMASSLTSCKRISKERLHLAGVQYITTNTGNTERSSNYTISVEIGMRIINQDISQTR
jgi:hypothetical protein